MDQYNPQVKPIWVFGDVFSTNCISLLFAVCYLIKMSFPCFFVLPWGGLLNKLPNGLKKG